MYSITHYKLRLIKDRTKHYPLNSIKSADDASKVFLPLMRGLPHEEVIAIFLNGQNKILGTQTLAMGGLHGCALLSRDVFRGAIVAGANAIIMAHNHPSGSVEPSSEDVAMTMTVKQAGDLLGITLLDHLVIAGNNYTSILGK